MKPLLTLLLVLFSTASFAQANQENVFLGRDFWRSNPSVAEVVQQIESGNDPVAFNAFKFDALCYAILENAQMDVFRYLLQLEGNDVRKITHDGRNYLMWAAYKGNIPLMKLLIDKGSDVKLVDDYGFNLMTFAAFSKQSDMSVFDVIIKNGGSIADTNRQGATSFLLQAAHISDEASLQYFLDKGASFEMKDNLGNTIFHYAAKHGNHFMMDKALSKGLDPSAKNIYGENAVIAAAQGGRRFVNSIETFKYLDSVEVPMLLSDKKGNTALHLAARNQNRIEVIEFLIRKGLKMNQRNEFGNTPLIEALLHKNELVASYLILHSQNVNHRNNEDVSAIMIALKNQQQDVVKLLVQKGAQLQGVDGSGKGAFEYLFAGYNDDTLSFVSLMALLQEKGITPVQSFDDGKNLFHLAVENQSLFLVEKAIDFKLDINQKTKDGATPLHLAAMKSQDTYLLKKLLEAGANINAKSVFGESAYDLALENEKLEKEILDFLKPS